LLHTATLSDLKPETGYFYQVIVEEHGREGVLRSPVSSFQTASLPKSPFAFAVMGDTQGNPAVNGELAKLAWSLRPNFLVIPGDLVDDGPVKNQWVNEFFASMNPLFSRVAFYPVLGNHERDADHYYRYMDLPPPEYYYTFQYGNAKFFMLDSNKKVDPESEQYLWLEKELENLRNQEENGTSDIVWKFVSYHHPSYSSDEDDYGNLWKGKSTWGDLRIRPLTELFDRYGVDIVWNGHIHSYERTWPIKNGITQEVDGTTYMITGGGGGGLEQAGPIRPPFQNNVRRGHHFVFVAVNGSLLELKSYDLEGRLFDCVSIRKKP
jgi:acid phosphatase type 7